MTKQVYINVDIYVVKSQSMMWIQNKSDNETHTHTKIRDKMYFSLYVYLVSVCEPHENKEQVHAKQREENINKLS